VFGDRRLEERHQRLVVLAARYVSASVGDAVMAIETGQNGGEQILMRVLQQAVVLQGCRGSLHERARSLGVEVQDVANTSVVGCDGKKFTDPIPVRGGNAISRLAAGQSNVIGHHEGQIRCY